MPSSPAFWSHAPHRRLQVIERLARAGVPVGVSVAPQIPFINEDMEQVLEAAAQAGARSAFYSVLRLPWELSPLFRQWLEQHYPQRQFGGKLPRGQEPLNCPWKRGKSNLLFLF